MLDSVDLDRRPVGGPSRAAPAPGRSLRGDPAGEHVVVHARVRSPSEQDVRAETIGAETFRAHSFRAPHLGWCGVSPAKSVPAKVPAKPPVARRSAKAQTRQELIEATIESLAKRGYEATTLADVASGAGLSRGIVNFHFETKEKLLVETLRHLADEYRGHWRGAVRAAGPDPAARLWALASADFDRKVCTTKKLAAWCAFWGEAKSRPTYRELCSANDEEYQTTVVDLVGRLAAPGQDAPALARALVCLLEGLWLNLMMAPKDFRREQALACVHVHLATVFPAHFTTAGPRSPAAPPRLESEPAA